MQPQQSPGQPPDFEKLLQKYLRQECSDAEKQLVENWYANLPEHKLTEKEASNLTVVKKQIWRQIQASTYQASPLAIIRRINSVPTFFKYGAVAAIIIAGWLTILKTDYRLSFWEKDTPAMAYAVEPLKQNQVIFLPDSSRVTLKAGSQIRYQYQANIREIYLTGEAFFEVKKNKDQPFLVHAGKVITKVLGTSFTVKMAGDPSQAVEVAVKTGKVAVSNQEKISRNFLSSHDLTQTPVVLTPNQKAIFHPAKRKISVGLVKNPAIIPQKVTKQKQFIFKDMPLPLVVQSLQEAYGVKIELAESLKKCPLTANLTNENFFTKIELICAALQAEYQVQDARVILTGKGCE